MTVDADYAALFVKAIEPFVVSVSVWHRASCFSFSPFDYLLETGKKAKRGKGERRTKNIFSLFA
jgi:hypothetical protein